MKRYAYPLAIVSERGLGEGSNRLEVLKDIPSARISLTNTLFLVLKKNFISDSQGAITEGVNFIVKSEILYPGLARRVT